MTNSNPNVGARLPNDALLSHAGGLRALAYDLLGDAHAADDVLQDTFVRALVSPPPRQHSAAGVRAWLRTVVRGVALNRRRNEAHRTERETRYVREREGEENDERGELLRTVVEAVLALDEPYRGVVLARYFEGLSTAQIAERTRTPLPTVASRLQRAHQLLRTRLEGEFGPRHGLAPALWMLAGAPAGSAPLAHVASSSAHASAQHVASSTSRHVATRTPLASPQTLVAATGVAALGVLAFVWHAAQGGNSATDAALAQRAMSDAADAGAHANALEAGPNAAPSRTADAAPPTAIDVAPAIAPAVSATGAYAYALEVVVHDDDGASVAGAAVFGAPSGQPLVRLGATGFDGHLALTWRAFEPELAFVFSTHTRDHELVRATLRANARESLALTTPRPWMRVVKAGDATRVRFAVARSSGVTQLVESRGGSAPEFTLDDRGNGVFVDPYLLVDDAPPSVPILSEVPLVGRMFRAESQRAGVLEVSSLTPGAPPAPAPGVVTCELRGSVRDGAGEPVAKTQVRVRRAGGGTLLGVTDEHGAFAIPDVPLGAALLVVASPDAGYAEQRLALDEAHESAELVLAQRAALRVHLVDELGAPLAEWRVEAELAGDLHAHGASAVTDADGRVVLPTRGAGPFRILARRQTSGCVPSLVVATDVWPQTGELELVVKGGGTRARVDVLLASATGRALDAGQLRLWRADSGRGVVVPRADDAAVAPRADGGRAPNWSIEGLAPGRYTLDGGAPGEPWCALATFEVSAGAHMALELALSAPRAELELAFADEAPRERVQGVIEIVRDGVLARSPEFACELPRVLTIPSGDGELVWTRWIVKDAPAETPAETLAQRDTGAVVSSIGALSVETVGGFEVATPKPFGARATVAPAEPGVPERHTFRGRAGARARLELAPLATPRQ